VSQNPTQNENKAKNTLTIPSELPSVGTIASPVVPPLAAPAAAGIPKLPELPNLVGGLSTEQLQALQIRQLMLQVEEMEERAGLKKQKAEQLRAQRLQNALEIKKKLAENKFQQDHCPHLKESGKPNTAGQRDAHGNYIIFCQHHNCMKTWHSGPHWTNDEKYNPEKYPNGDVPQHPRGIMFSESLPTHLYPPAERVGGPVSA
jgi:hypothetical protein